ncbi:MBL fold metallo-hydrolase [Mesobacillus maritimus]|uniref:MBL fold metallo-hydrolase n=1 Tax=Mesobacillus maritimus TaxID=1643336 RepID=UPI00203CEB1F|nr:MBL fold metallo-hydrolase [Mesobacillus maritimus]MCM3586075.1 MBL fold metallo-hydrolase [Mesobacillus maritimus]MCM3667402.1 MBL fold metallo-hydrolase [Mesobacillus maritimus]
MKLTVIGCWGGYPKKNEASSGYLLEHDGFKLLIDCGSGVLSKMQNFVQPEQLDALVLSHYHPDHNADIGVLYHARLIQGFLGKKPPVLPIYGHNLDQAEFSKLTYKNVTTGVAYQLDQTLEVGPFRITFLRTVHPVPCFAMRIEVEGKVLVYTADTAYKEEFTDFSRNADVLLCECNFYGQQSGKGAGHMNSFDTGKLASLAEVKRLVLTHLPHYGDLNQLLEEAKQKYNGPIQLAHEGLTISL